MPKKVLEKETVVIAKCVQCQKKKDVRAGEVPKDEMPMCDSCFMPMVAMKAETRVKKARV